MFDKKLIDWHRHSNIEVMSPTELQHQIQFADLGQMYLNLPDALKYSTVNCTCTASVAKCFVWCECFREAKELGWIYL